MSLSADRRSAWLKYRSLWKPEEAGPRHLLLKEGDISRIRNRPIS